MVCGYLLEAYFIHLFVPFPFVDDLLREYCGCPHGHGLGANIKSRLHIEHFREDGNIPDLCKILQVRQ